MLEVGSAQRVRLRSTKAKPAILKQTPTCPFSAEVTTWEGGGAMLQAAYSTGHANEESQHITTYLHYHAQSYGVTWTSRFYHGIRGGSCTSAAWWASRGTYPRFPGGTVAGSNVQNVLVQDGELAPVMRCLNAESCRRIEVVKYCLGLKIDHSLP